MMIREAPHISIFEIPQVIAQGEIKVTTICYRLSYSCLVNMMCRREAWLCRGIREIDCTVGEFARQRGAEIPNRLVSSSKSWLCNSSIDRTKPILPWESPSRNTTGFSRRGIRAFTKTFTRMHGIMKWPSDDPGCKIRRPGNISHCPGFI